MSDRGPYIPSELLEPHLSKFFGLVVAWIGAEDEFPSIEKWREWHFMLKGIEYFVIGTDARHANIAFGNELCKIDPLYPQKGFDEEKARIIWETCRLIMWARDGDECPLCKNGTIEYKDGEVRCRGECGVVRKI